MNVFEAIGTCWVILTSSLATVSIGWAAFIGVKFLYTIATDANDALNDQLKDNEKRAKALYPLHDDR